MTSSPTSEGSPKKKPTSSLSCIGVVHVKYTNTGALRSVSEAGGTAAKKLPLIKPFGLNGFFINSKS